MTNKIRRPLAIVTALVAVWLAARGIAEAQKPLPNWFQQADVGDVGLPGSASISADNELLVNGAGSDIWGTADSFHFVYQTLYPSVADGAITAFYSKQDATNPFAKVGIMIRLSLDPGAPHVILDVKPDGSIEFMTRSTQDGPTTFVAGFPPADGELSLTRQNGIVTAFVCSTGPCRAIGSVPFPTGLALYGVAVTSHDPTTLNHGVFHFTVPTVYPLPTPWISQDVGEVGLAGDAFEENGTFTLKGAGSDVWGTSDAYRRATTVQMNGDGGIVARVTSEDAANSFAKAGIVMAGGNASGVAMVILDIRPNGVIEFMARSAYQAPMQFLAGSAATFPVWLKLVKRDQQFTGYMSGDGRSWQTVGVTTSPLDGYEAGLVVTSHDTSALNTATFDHVMAASSFPTHTDVGDVGVIGRTDTIDVHGGFAVQGGGADIWGTADAFQFYNESLMDDGQMVMRVNSLDNTDGFAKAGVMIRESLDPSAAHVLLDVTPSGLIELLTRESSGAQTQWIGGRSASPFPIWLKLARSGTRILASTSPDGSTWTDVGTASTLLPPDALIGVAVTSHRRGVLATATVGNISR
jgi:hypothetical protein